MQILEWVKRQTGKLADNVKDYKFYVKNQPNFIDSSTTLFLTAFANRDELQTIPAVYRWSRIKNGLINEVPEFKGNTFICEPSDIGCIIQAEITSTDQKHPGTAVLKFGPVKLDVLMKKQVEHALTSGCANMNVDLVQGQDNKECQIKICEETIKISHFNSNNTYTFDYSMGDPRIEVAAKETNKVVISFSEKYDTDVTKFVNSLFGFQQLTASMRGSNEKRLQLLFANRGLKDQFLLIVKAFNTKKAIKTSSVVGKLQKIDLSGDENFSYMLEIESLRADLIKLARLNDKFLADKKMCYEQNRKLQKQIEEIIVTYTKIAQGKCKNQNELDQSVMQLRQKRDEVMQRKLHSLMRQNQNLKDKIQYMNDEMTGRTQIEKQRNNQTQNIMASSRSSRGGFIKKRTVHLEPVNQFEQILNNMNETEIKEPVLHSSDKEKSMLVKQLNKSVVKIAKLQEKVKQLKLNQTMNMNMLDINNISGISSNQQQKRMNLTSMQLGLSEKQKFCSEIEQLRRKNLKLKQENFKLKSQIPMISSHTQRINGEQNKSQRIDQKSVRYDEIRSQRATENNKSMRFEQQKSVRYDDNKSVKSAAVNHTMLNPEKGNSNIQKQLNRKIQQLSQQNSLLKEQIQRLIIQKDVILKEKQTIQQKYKKKMSELSNQNSIYKRNQDALNRSQNLSMEMESFNEQQNNMLKQQNQFLSNENLKITKMHQKSIQQLKQIPKLKQQILKLQLELSGKKSLDFNISKSEDSMLLKNL